MIYALGLATDGTLAHYTARAAADVTLVDLTDLAADGAWRLALPDDGDSWLLARDQRHDLRPGDGYYCRLADLSALEDDPGLRARWHGLLAALTAWLDTVPGPVVNRPGTAGDNGSKPLHEVTLARCGLTVPESLTSSDAGRLRAFAAAGPAIVKALSGVRADSRLIGPEEFDTFTPHQGPVHLQRYIAGSDVRVHVCGDAVHAEEAVSSAVDYRTAPPEDVVFRPHELPAPLAAQLTARTRDLGLAFAGWDLKRDADGTYWCLEANPMPGYDWYDRRADGAITASLTDLLTGDPA
ncbi:RimK family alpha-L-glutamate ligase [Streptomyces cinerochromogenes]|uniref:RimK family alpha-L-glutamate ligase n=1 Tax=Streptomyces cinerochromogenes TaxID=66422 RepID=A0ABW7B8M0_9ACTN